MPKDKSDSPESQAQLGTLARLSLGAEQGKELISYPVEPRSETNANPGFVTQQRSKPRALVLGMLDRSEYKPKYGSYTAKDLEDRGDGTLGFKRLTPRDTEHLTRLTKAAEYFAPAKDWYGKAHNIIKKHLHTGVADYTHTFIPIMAASSPQKTVDNNLIDAFLHADAIITGKPLRSGLGSELTNVVRGASTGEVSGQKIFSFNRNLSGDLSFLTNDTHMSQIYKNRFDASTKQIRPGEYPVLNAVGHHIANKLGWQPAETQAALWDLNLARTQFGSPHFKDEGFPFPHYAELNKVMGKEGDTSAENVGVEGFFNTNAKLIKSFTDKWDAHLLSKGHKLHNGPSPYIHTPLHDTVSNVDPMDIIRNAGKNDGESSVVTFKDVDSPGFTRTNSAGQAITTSDTEFFGPGADKKLAAKKDELRRLGIKNEAVEEILSAVSIFEAALNLSFSKLVAKDPILKLKYENQLNLLEEFLGNIDNIQE